MRLIWLRWKLGEWVFEGNCVVVNKNIYSKDGKAKIHHHSNLQEDLFVYEGKQTLGFGNSNPKVPYKKVVNGVKRFESIINESKSQEGLVGELLQLLKWEEQHLPDAELERRAPQAFKGLSSIFVKIIEAGYGTR